MIVDVEDDPLLGLDLFKSFGFRLYHDEVEIRQLGTADVHSQFSTLFNRTVGRLEGFQHKIRIQEGAKPVATGLRRPPMALYDKTLTAITDMESAGIIERVDHSEWVHPMVVTSKPNGEVRVCCDLRALNQAVISERFPTPTTEELLTEIGGSKMFAKLHFKQAYHQIALTDESHRLTTFLTPLGL